ncbi:MAG: hypothetical protein ABSB69_09040 [Solirubrobacteraceae bacterium]
MFASSRPTAFNVTRRLVIAVTACLVVLGSSAASALAAAPEGCASGPTSTPFERFGDSAEYSLVQGGSFESGAPGWSLTNSAVAAGNESYEVEGGTQSLAIQPGGVAVSPAMCVSTADPTFRFFARRTSGSWGVLNVILRWTDSSGATHDTTVASLQAGTSWTPTPILELASALPLWQSGSTLNVKLVFQPERYGGAWAIDDVYIDPRMS